MSNVWVAFGLALAVAVALILTGKWTAHAMLALIVLLIISAMFPPVGIAILGMVLLFLLLTNPKIFSNNLVNALDAIKGGFTTKPQ